MTDTTANTVHFQADHAHEAHAHEDHKPGFFARWFMSTNHKDIGTLYLIFAIMAGIIGGTISGLMRWELMEPGVQYLEAWSGAASFDEALHLWNVLITAHGLIMVFFMVMPAMRSEEHTSELQSLMRISYAVFCLNKKKLPNRHR